jgi:hypothetical protein
MTLLKLENENQEEIMCEYIGFYWKFFLFLNLVFEF